MPTNRIPELSVVIASFSGVKSLKRCLESLAPEMEGEQIVVATTERQQSIEELATRFSQVQFLYAPADSNVFRLRSLGLAKARGGVVALTEDHFTMSPGWVESLRAEARNKTFILGGPIDNGLTRRAFEWALYFVEYSAFMPPMHDGPIEYVSAANVAYPRDLLHKCRSVWQHEFHDPAVHAALRRLGCRCYLVKNAEVKSHLNFSMPVAMSHLCAGGLWFGKYRQTHAPWIWRIIWCCSAPMIPLVMIGRIVRRVLRRRPALIPTVACSFLYSLLLVMAWSIGEMLGYWSAALSVMSTKSIDEQEIETTL